jgi:alginate O-acetyltransferase complex protein AlgJ
MRARRNLALLIYIVLWAASLTSFVLVRDFYPKEFENRSWATMPVWSELTVQPRQFFKQTTDYIADHFGLRSSFIRLYNVLKYAVFHVSPDAIVLPGKDGWLFYVGDGNLAFDRNVAPFTDTQLNDLVHRLKKTEAWLSKRGIVFMVAIPPDPPSVYPEKLPDWVVFLPGLTRRQ